MYCELPTKYIVSCWLFKDVGLIDFWIIFTVHVGSVGCHYWPKYQPTFSKYIGHILALCGQSVDWYMADVSAGSWLSFGWVLVGHQSKLWPMWVSIEWQPTLNQYSISIWPILYWNLTDMLVDVHVLAECWPILKEWLKECCLIHHFIVLAGIYQQ